MFSASAQVIITPGARAQLKVDQDGSGEEMKANKSIQPVARTPHGQACGVKSEAVGKAPMIGSTVL